MSPRRRALRYASLIFLPCIAVYFLHERLLTNHDPGNFLAAIELGLDTIDERPHVPGYPFFVLLWRGLVSVGLTPEQAILVSNAFWCSIGLPALYRLARKFVTEDLAYLAALFAACNPHILFYAATGETYAYDLAFSSLLVLALVSVRREHLSWVWLAAGLAGGFRLSSLVFMYPVMLTVSILKKEQARSIVWQHLHLLAGVLAWLIPFVLHHGGWREFGIIVRATMDLESTILQSASGYLGALLWMVNLALPLLLLAPAAFRKWPPGKRWLLLAWIVVPTLFFLFRFYAKGYIIITLPAIAILLASAVGLLEDWKRRLADITMRVGGLIVFFAIPFVPPSLELEASSRMQDRVATAALRTLSWFAPSYSHLQVREKSMLTAKRMIERWTNAGDTIVLDRSAGMWAHPRTLQYHVRDRHIVVPTGGGYTTDFFGLRKYNKLSLEEQIPRDSALFLCDDQLIHRIPMNSQFRLVDYSDYLSLYRAPHAELYRFLQSLE